MSRGHRTLPPAPAPRRPRPRLTNLTNLAPRAGAAVAWAVASVGPGPTTRHTTIGTHVSTLLLIVIIVVLAAAAGFLGTLLEVAGWIVLGFVVLGALLGFVVWRWIRSRLPSD